MIGNSIIADAQLQQYINTVMQRYDYNRSGTLEPGELVNCFNDLYSMCGFNRRIVTLQDALNLVRKVDCNFDGKVNKYELFKAFKFELYQNSQSSWDPNYRRYTGGW